MGLEISEIMWSLFSESLVLVVLDIDVTKVGETIPESFQNQEISLRRTVRISFHGKNNVEQITTCLLKENVAIESEEKNLDIQKS